MTANLVTLIAKYSKNIKCKQKKAALPWLKNEIHKLALKTSLSSKLITDHLIYKSLRNKVVLELHQAKASYYTQLTGNAKDCNVSL